MASAQQPVWVETKKILDIVLSYVPFECQATTMRLICKPFKAFAVRGLEDKLLNQTWLPIAFERFDTGSWFRTDARRGWSDQFADRDDVVDEALWMLSCRCGIRHCQDKNTCPSMKCRPFVRGCDDTTKKLDLDEVRRVLATEGELSITPTSRATKKSRYNPSVKVAFEQKTGLNLCQRVHRKCEQEVGYRYLPETLSQHYGVSVPMSSKRFLRSLFLVFTNCTSLTDGHFPEITVARTRELLILPIRHAMLECK